MLLKVCNTESEMVQKQAAAWIGCLDWNTQQAMLGEIEVGEATGRCKMAYQARLGVGGLFVCQSCAQRGQVEGVVIRLLA